jgi:hypothetical protein
MYTVKELIETLQQCPEDYEVMLVDTLGDWFSIDTLGVNNDTKTVNLFP